MTGKRTVPLFRRSPADRSARGPVPQQVPQHGQPQLHPRSRRRNLDLRVGAQVLAEHGLYVGVANSAFRQLLVVKILGQIGPATEQPSPLPPDTNLLELGAAVQAAWDLGGGRPEWPVAISAEPALDTRPGIRAGYAARRV